MFKDIKEDEFESSGDEQEKQKNDKLLRLGKLAQENEEMQAKAKEMQDKNLKLMSQKSKTNEDEKTEEDEEMQNDDGHDKIQAVEEGDILRRFRIPFKNNKFDSNI